MDPIKMYAAAVFTNSMQPGQPTYERYLTDHEKKIARETPHILESYHYIGKDRIAQQIRATGRKIFLDSGAFSAKHAGAEIDINQYCHFIKKYEDIFLIDDGIPVIAGLDVIGDAEQTYHNLKVMESQGIQALPTYHIHEDEKVLEWYVANYEYICIGGVAAISSTQAITWMDRLWERYLTDGAGRPKVKVHGFATTSIPIMERYGWWSVDSSTWVQAASFGGVWTPDGESIKISSKSPARHTARKHFTTMPPVEAAYFESMLRDLGFDPKRLAEVPYARFAYNLWTYARLNEKLNERKARIQEIHWQEQLF